MGAEKVLRKSQVFIVAVLAHCIYVWNKNINRTEFAVIYKPHKANNVKLYKDMNHKYIILT